MIRAGILDWNGACLNDLPVVYKSVKQIFEEFGLKPPTLQEYRTGITYNFSDFYYSHGVPKSASREDLNKIRQRVLEDYWRRVELQKGARRLVNLCIRHEIKLALISGEGPIILARRQIQFEKFFAKFDHVEGGAVSKQRPISRFLRRHGIKPDEAFIVDDGPGNIITAKKLGLITFGLTSGYSPTSVMQAARPTFVVKTFYEIIEELEKLLKQKPN